MTELKIGQMAIIAGIKVKCVKDDPHDEFNCTRCVGGEVYEACNELECSALSRADKTYVHFVRARTMGKA